MGQSHRNTVDWWCKAAKVSPTYLLAMESAALKLVPSDYGPPWSGALVAAKNWAWAIIFVLSLVGVTAEVLEKNFGRAWEWKFIRDQLEDLRERVFNEPAHAELGSHRVTLFQFKQFCWRWPRISFRPKFWIRWPWSGWLVQVARSGHMTQNSKTCFFAPDDPDLCEGIAGRAWCNRKGVLVDKLPTITASSATTRKNKYALRSWVPPRWIEKAIKKNQHPDPDATILPRALFGIHIEGPDGRWGVLVLDSKHETLLSEADLITLCTPVCKNLARVVNKV